MTNNHLKGPDIHILTKDWMIRDNRKKKTENSARVRLGSDTLHTQKSIRRDMTKSATILYEITAGKK